MLLCIYCINVAAEREVYFEKTKSWRKAVWSMRAQSTKLSAYHILLNQDVNPYIV